MRKAEFLDRLTDIGITINESAVDKWIYKDYIGYISLPGRKPLKRSTDKKDGRFRKKNGYGRGQTGKWTEYMLITIVDLWSMWNPQNEGIKPLANDRCPLVLKFAFHILSDTTKMFPLDWGVPNFHTWPYEVDNTDRWLVSDELHPYIVRVICNRQKLLDGIDVSTPVKVNLIWEEELVEPTGDTQAEIQYRLKPITIDRNVDLDAVEMQVIPLERRINEDGVIETNKAKTQNDSLIFCYEIYYSLRVIPKKGFLTTLKKDSV
jgi:hypothetical protein